MMVLHAEGCSGLPIFARPLLRRLDGSNPGNNIENDVEAGSRQDARGGLRPLAMTRCAQIAEDVLPISPNRVRFVVPFAGYDSRPINAQSSTSTPRAKPRKQSAAPTGVRSGGPGGRMARK
jgi:hypothetical protein